MAVAVGRASVSDNTYNDSLQEQETLNCLVQWALTFDLGVEIETAHDLTSGLIFSKILHKIDPLYFTPDWQSKLTDASSESNWRIKASNLKRVWSAVQEYYQETLGQSLSFFHTPDFNITAEHADPVELKHFLQLIVGIATKCENQQYYIQKIMLLDESVQASLMQTIQELQSCERPRSFVAPNSQSLHAEIHELNEQYRALKDSYDELQERCHVLDSQVVTISEERDVLENENNRLVGRLTESENFDDPNSTVGKRLFAMQQQLEQLQDENYKVEQSREDMRMQAQVSDRLVKDHAKTIEEQAHVEGENRRLKDEMDELRIQLSEFQKKLGTVDIYKRKAEEAGDLKIQIKLLEDKNAVYVKSAIDLDEEQSRCTVLKKQLELCKAQLSEAGDSLQEEIKRADKNEFERNRVQQKLDTISHEKERLLEKKMELEEINEDLSCQVQAAATSPSDSEPDSLSVSTYLHANNHPDLTERLKRLEEENKRLKAGTTSNSEVEIIQTELDECRSQKSELESELRIANRKELELQGQIDDLNECLSGKDQSSDSRLLESGRKLELVSLEVQKYKEICEDCQNRLTGSEQRCQSLEAELNDSIAKWKQGEEKYRESLQKSQAVIVDLEKAKSLHPSEPSPHTKHEVESLKRELQEKERVITRLHEDQERMRILREQEERLIITSFHAMAVQLHRVSSEDRLAAVSQTPNSVLGRQRQIVSRPSKASMLSNNTASTSSSVMAQQAPPSFASSEFDSVAA